jgi:hypothetical protein
MNNLRQNFQHAQWGSIIGYEADIRLAVLKDEVELWQKRVGNDPDSIPYSVIIRNTLKSRIEELEKSAILIKERDKL